MGLLGEEGFRAMDSGVEQLVAQVAHTHQVAGSSPVPATKEEALREVSRDMWHALLSRPFVWRLRRDLRYGKRREALMNRGVLLKRVV